MKWAEVSIGRVVEVNPRDGDWRDLDGETEVTFVPMAAVSEVTASIADRQIRPLHAVRKGYTAFREGDVILAKITPCLENGKVAIASDLANGRGFGSTEFHVLRPSASLDARFLYHFLRQESFRIAAKARMRGAAGQQRVPEDFVRNYSIVLPPPSEQHRIVEILDEADRLRHLRAEADAKAERILTAVAARFIGSPSNWASDPASQPLGDLVDPVSGATPAKTKGEYWDGQVPWVSPKDMKREFLSDSEDHVSEIALEESTLKIIAPESVLIVVRGMILARDVPVAMNLVPVTINQDMKALVPRTRNVSGAYIWAALRLAKVSLQSLVGTSGHGTRKLDTPDLMQFRIIVPSPKQLNQVDSAVRQHRLYGAQRESASAMLAKLYAVLLSRGFDGSLTAAWRRAHMKELLQEMEHQARTLAEVR